MPWGVKLGYRYVYGFRSRALFRIGTKPLYISGLDNLTSNEGVSCSIQLRGN